MKLPPEPLTPDEARQLIAACNTRYPTGLRNRAMLTVLYRAGLRVSEALALEPRDLCRQTGAIRVRHGKGDKSRVVGLDAGGWSVLDQWLELRARRALCACLVFCTLKGTPLATSYVRALLRRLRKKTGIAKRVHPHGLRHTHAFELANEGTPLHIIQAQLGHSSVATTSRYIAHLAPTEVMRAMQAREWTL